MIQGNFFDGSDSKLHAAELTLSGDTVIVHDSVSRQILLQIESAALAINARVGNSIRAITFNDGSKFETNDNVAVDALQAQIAPSKQQWLYWLENHYPMMFAMLASIIIIGWLSVQYGIPGSAKWVAHQVPADLYYDTGEETLKYMDKAFLEPSTLSINRQQTLRNTFLSQLDELELDIPIRIEFRQGNLMGANAFALPSGMIVFTDELVNMACDDQELIAIFGHELGHIEHRHMIRSVLQSSFIAIATVMLIGDASFLGEVIIALPAFLLEMNYSRGFEQEADAYALAFMQQKNITPGFFTSIMSRLERSPNPDDVETVDAEQEPSNLEGYFLTHPLTEERIKQFGQPAIQCPAKS
ncbi:hypothetical protein A9Q79_02075 [Methylophaga sp. 42_25_T18]|nr:hypothetical protein A9Q79_02075 [Methylophaga sp. 42_25_T18]OUR88784.1 hypothetical protein A9Q92_02240 [Methylophaga sp. 42_8_T64]